MSIVSAKSFIERTKTDQEFARKIHEFKSMDEAQRYIASQGYEFTIEDLQSCYGELSQEELDVVAGGGFPIITCQDLGNPLLKFPF